MGKQKRTNPQKPDLPDDKNKRKKKYLKIDVQETPVAPGSAAHSEATQPKDAASSGTLHMGATLGGPDLDTPGQPKWHSDFPLPGSGSGPSDPLSNPVRKKRDLNVTIAEADNYSIAKMAPPSNKKTAAALPEDTPRRSLRLQGRAPWNEESLDSPLSIGRHVEKSLGLGITTGDTPYVAGDTPHIFNLSQPPSQSESTLSNDSLKFCFEDLDSQFPSPLA